MALWQDVRFGWRSFVQAPGFTLAAAGALALAIGANTSIFSVMKAVLWEPLPYPEAHRVYLVERHYEGSDGQSPPLAGSKFLYVRDHAQSFEGVGAIDVAGAGFNLTGVGEPDRVPGARISSELLPVLGVPPFRGRSFTREEDLPGGPDVAVISHGLWTRKFSGGDSAVGARIDLNGRPHTVIGVMPAGFGIVGKEDVFLPLRKVFDPEDLANAFLVLGRLKAGVDVRVAEQELRQISARFRAEHPKLIPSEKEYFGVRQFRETIVGDVRPALLVLAGAVGFVLLIACANVANLLLARATGRQREIAIRTAMGANQWRLIRQLLTESVMLSLLGAVVGVLLAFWGLRLLQAMIPDSIPSAGSIGVDGGVLAFTAALAVVTGMVFGIVPAWSSARIRINETLKEASGRTGTSKASGRLRSMLVVAEIAVSVILLVGAGLLIQSYVRLRSVQMGIQPGNVVTMKMALQKHTTTGSLMSFVDPLLKRLETMPGVVSMGTVTSLPTEGGTDLPMEVVGETSPEKGGIEAQYRAVSPRYFEALGVRLMKGRMLTERDNAGGAKVVLVNEAFAKKTLGVKDPIGRQVRPTEILPPALRDEAREIVGVVADIRELGVNQDPVPTMYVPQAQVKDSLTALIQPFLPLALVVKTQGDPLSVVPEVRRLVLSVDPQQPVAEVRTMEEVLSRSTARDRFNLSLMAVFAAIALILAAVGIYGVISYSTAQRSQEMGVRLALGAGRGDILRMVLSEGMGAAVIGVVAGLGGAFALSRFVSTLLFGVTATDPWTFAGVAGVLLLVAAAANLMPALRATRVDPVRALRYE